MASSVAERRNAELPFTLPIFPLSGVMLLPRCRLPLNIFEPRYVQLVEDVMDGDRMIGMVQPLDPATEAESPAVYPAGCAGRITSCEESPDGRYKITLTGVSRFEVERELEAPTPYRQVVPRWDRYEEDLELDRTQRIERELLLDRLRDFFEEQGLGVDWKIVGETSDEQLVNSMAMICPFEPVEKQALLEAVTLSERGGVMTAILEMYAPTPIFDDVVVLQ